MSSILSASDRRELIDLLVEFEGLSRAAAKRLAGDAKPYDLVQSLARLRQAKLERQGQARLPLHPKPAPRQEAPVARSNADPRAKKVPYSLLLPPEQLDALRVISERDDSSVSHHIRQAIRAYLRSRPM